MDRAESRLPIAALAAPRPLNGRHTRLTIASIAAQLSQDGTCVNTTTAVKAMTETAPSQPASSPSRTMPLLAKKLKFNELGPISGLTITGGSTSGSGGGVYVKGGIANLTDCTITGNSAGVGSQFGGYGAGLCNQGGGQVTPVTP